MIKSWNSCRRGKCSSATFCAALHMRKMRFTGLVRGASMCLTFASVLGSLRSSAPPLSIDLSRGASCSCLYAWASWCACSDGMAWYVRSCARISGKTTVVSKVFYQMNDVQRLTVEGCVHATHVHKKTHHGHAFRSLPVTKQLVPQNLAGL